MDFGKWLARGFSSAVHSSELLLGSIHETAEILLKVTAAGYKKNEVMLVVHKFSVFIVLRRDVSLVWDF